MRTKILIELQRRLSELQKIIVEIEKLKAECDFVDNRELLQDISDIFRESYDTVYRQIKKLTKKGDYCRLSKKILNFSEEGEKQRNARK